MKQTEVHSLKNKSSNLILAAGICLFAALSVFSQAFASGVSRGLEFCANLLIPSVFPFLIAAVLTGMGTLPESLCKIISPFTERVFGLPAQCAPVIALSQVGGYLSGAKSVHSLYSCGIISEKTAERMLLFCINAGMGFSVNAIGSGMLDSRQAGKVIFASLCISSLINGITSRFFIKDGTDSRQSHPRVRRSISSAVTESVSSGGAAMINACIFTVAFSGVGAIFDKYIAHGPAKKFVSCLLEVTKGCSDISGIASLPVIAAVCGFGGLCVHVQIFSVTNDIKINLPRFYLFRVLNSVTAYAVCRLILYFHPVTVPVSLVINPPAAVFSFSAPAAISLLFLCALLILDLDNGEKIC